MEKAGKLEEGTRSYSSVVISNSSRDAKFQIYIENVKTSYLNLENMDAGSIRLDMKDPNGNEFIFWKISLKKMLKLNPRCYNLCTEMTLLDTNLPNWGRHLLISFPWGDLDFLNGPYVEYTVQNGITIPHELPWENVLECSEPDGVYCHTILIKVCKLTKKYISLQSNVPSKYILRGPNCKMEWLKRLYQDRSGGDATIKCGDRTFHIHQFILDESPVLAKMLDTPMLEAATKTIQVEDVRPEAIQLLIKFLYLGEIDPIPNDLEIFSGLLYSADKYDLPECKRLCFYQMLRDISLENAPTFNTLAFTFSDDEGLKQVFRDYCFKNRGTLLMSKAYQELVAKFPLAFHG